MIFIKVRQKNKFEFLNKQTQYHYIFLWFLQRINFIVFWYMCANTTNSLGVVEIVGPG